MLKVTIPEQELYDELNNEFITVNKQTLQLEHSLVSLSKWESKWHKPFINDKEKTKEETIDYIRCMTITQNVDPHVYDCIPMDVLKEVGDYIKNPMTATKITEHKKPGGRSEIPTAEVIYYWMITLDIPFECQKWHLNRLLTLIRVCNIKSGSEKKMSKAETMKSNAALNAARRKKFNSRG